jgi:hypothetical protein
MKEQTLIELKNKVETLGKLTQYLMQETKQLKDLAIGTLETIKIMPGYEDAIESLKEKMNKEVVEEKKLEL